MHQLIFSILVLKNHWQTNNRFRPILIRKDIETQMSPHWESLPGLSPSKGLTVKCYPGAYSRSLFLKWYRNNYGISRNSIKRKSAKWRLSDEKKKSSNIALHFYEKNISQKLLKVADTLKQKKCQ